MIVINGRFLFQRRTGVQRYAVELCKRLPKEIDGHEILIVGPANAPDLLPEDEKHFRVHRFGVLKSHLWEQYELVRFLGKKQRPLLVNLSGIGPLIYRNKLVALYDLAFKHHPEWFSFAFRKAYNLAIPLSVRNARGIITDSNYVKGDIAQTYKIPEERIDVIYAAPSEMFQRLDLPQEKFVLTVSSIDPRKNLGRVIEAFSQLESDYRLVIVGAKNKTFARVAINTGELKNNIEFTGYLDDQALIELYNRASIFVYASLFEGFGIPPLEAQACGCPCLVSDKTALPEVYGNSVLYCDPYNLDSIRRGLERLIQDENIRKDLILKGNQNVKQYTWAKSTMEFVKVIENYLT